jgi:hypothetical protein
MEREKLETVALFTYGVLRLPIELLKDEMAFRRLGKLAAQSDVIHPEKPNE